MTRLAFTKMHGLGNDFVVLDGIAQKVDLTPAQLRLLAHRRLGVGCDQILVVERATRPDADFRYRIYNADGGEVEQCGNGARCFVRFVREQGLTTKDEIRVETKSGLISPRLEPPRQLLGYYYLDAGDTAAAVQHYVGLLKENPGDDALSYRLAGVYERMGRYEEALDLIDPLYRKEPEAKDLSVMVFTLAARANLPDRARAYMQDWLKARVCPWVPEG